MVDKQLSISVANSRFATEWKNQSIWWSELVKKLETPARSSEKLDYFLSLSKAKQDELKDVGGYVGGMLLRGKRGSKSVESRELITLDLDNIPAGLTDEVLKKISLLGCALVVHSTRKHEPARPRLRVVIPLANKVSAEEYEPVARKVAQLVGIEWADPTTFQASRLMYFPSCSSDSTYVFKTEEGGFLDPAGVLAMYSDWRNHTEWPLVPNEAQKHRQVADKQQDPREKSGIIGAFCRTYDIYRAMTELIPGVYFGTEHEDRFTYSGGSTAGGAVVYGGLWLYSHHATDPASGKLCNAWDLVRLHKFEDLDADARPDTPTNKLPSYVAMSNFAKGIKEVAVLLTKERYDEASGEFKTDITNDSSDWMSGLKINSNGAVEKTIGNISLILDNDPLLKDKIALDEFACRGVALGALPWNSEEEKRQWNDTDDAGLRWYLESVYGITGKDKIYDATALCAHKHAFNSVKDYLTGLSWDGVQRLENLFIDYFGAENSLYIKAVAKKSFVAAVTRVMQPGTKFDNMVIISGAQGIGKSTFFATLGGDWFSDSLMTFEGKEAAELIQGRWIVEVGELSGMSKSETNTVKQFLSKTDDIYREAYGRRTAQFPRKCVFFGTTNDSEYLRDPTGGRRFWPVDAEPSRVTKSVFNDLPKERDQIWAEAYFYWQLGEKLHLPKDVEAMARLVQEEHREVSIKTGMVRSFVEKEVPEGWNTYSLEQRRAYWSFEYKSYKGKLMKRDRICAAEIWTECFGKDASTARRQDTMEINGILGSLDGFKYCNKAMKFGCQGVQRGYKADTF
jgi:virulence-associated E family protein|uniref:Virulence associated protein E n=1 Tax=Siphoviridae sp. ctFiA6 TaxID=2823573 RepID=A0A8S5LG81_9CAUD|nr:MAG TPA: virulence associated protein E [Siphoviridae sp. ctFiA6]